MKVIKIQDVTFNKKLFYNLSELNLAAILKKQLDQIIEVVEIPHDPESLDQMDKNADLESDLDFDDKNNKSGAQLQANL